MKFLGFFILIGVYIWSMSLGDTQSPVTYASNIPPVSNPPAQLPVSVQRWWPEILEATENSTISPELIAVQMMVESCGHPFVCSHAGACGVMQFMPATAAGEGIDPLNPYQSIIAGVEYLEWNLSLFPEYGSDSIRWALGGYVQGPTGIRTQGWSSDAIWYADNILESASALERGEDTPFLQGYRNGPFCASAAEGLAIWDISAYQMYSQIGG